MPFKTAEEDEKEEEATASVVSAKEATMAVAVAAVLTELDVIFPIKEEALKAFLGGQDVAALLRTGVGKSLVKHSSTLQLIMWW